MKKNLLSIVALGLGLLGSASAAQPPAPVAGSIPNQPAIWCRFDGDTKNDGTAKAQWALQNTAFQGNALYLSGKYLPLKDATGDGFRATCSVDKIAKEHFTVALRFKRDHAEPGRNILTGGLQSRWFGISIDPSGGLEVTFNDGQLSRPIAGVPLRADGWNWLVCSVDLPAHKCTALLNGQMAAPIALPADFALNLRPPFETADNVWTFTNYADTRSFCGWVDEFLCYDRELTAVELTGLAHRREMLEPKLPLLTTPPAIASAKPAGKLLEDVPALTAADRANHPGTLAISSVGTTYSIAARVAGSYTWNANSVKVKLKQAEIIRQVNGMFPERKVLSFHVFLQRSNPALQYSDIVARSESVAVDTVIGHGQTVLVENVDVEIPLRGIPAAELGKMWLGVWINETHGAAPGTTPAPGPSPVGVCLAPSATCLNGDPRPADPVRPTDAGAKPAVRPLAETEPKKAAGGKP